MKTMATGNGYIAEGRGHLRPIIVEAPTRIEAMHGFYEIAAQQQRELFAADLDVCATCYHRDCTTDH